MALRVLVVGPLSPIGGVSRFVQTLLDKKIPGVNFFHFDISASREPRALRMLKAVLGFVCSLVSIRPDCVHYVWQSMSGTPRDVALVRIANLMGYRIIIDVRGGNIGDWIEHAERKGFLSRMVRDTLNLGSSVILQSSRLVEICTKELLSPVVCLPNTIPSSLVIPSYEVRQCAKTIAYAGHIIPEKGIATLLQAFQWLYEKDSELKLMLIGRLEDLGLGTEIESANGVEYTPEIDRQSLLNKLQMADIFVFPSYYKGEGHSNSLNDALSIGLPIIATTHNDNEAVLGNAGLLCRVKDATDLMEKMEKLLNDYPLRKRLSESTLVRALEFSEDVYNSRLVKLYIS